jgi:hypothetical protein
MCRSEHKVLFHAAIAILWLKRHSLQDEHTAGHNDMLLQSAPLLHLRVTVSVACSGLSSKAMLFTLLERNVASRCCRIAERTTMQLQERHISSSKLLMLLHTQQAVNSCLQEAQAAAAGAYSWQPCSCEVFAGACAAE